MEVGETEREVRATLVEHKEVMTHSLKEEHNSLNLNGISSLTPQRVRIDLSAQTLTGKSCLNTN